MNDIIKYDPEFTESKFKTFVDNVFIQIHMAIMTQELEKIKHFVSNDVYQNLQEKVKSLNKENLTQIYDELNVKDTIITDMGIIQDKMYIKVKIISRYMDYLIDENKNFVRGINTQRIEKENYLTLEKNINYIEQKNSRKCPGCGAPIDVNINGKCAYCDSFYNLDDKHWLLVSFKTN